jgi:hypothetical protein
VLDRERSESSSKTIPTSWAKVKLCHVGVKDTKAKNNETLQASESADSEGFRRILVRKKTIEKRNKLPQKNDQVVQATQSAESIAPSNQGPHREQQKLHSDQARPRRKTP